MSLNTHLGLDVASINAASSACFCSIKVSVLTVFADAKKIEATPMLADAEVKAVATREGADTTPTSSRVQVPVLQQREAVRCRSRRRVRALRSSKRMCSGLCHRRLWEQPARCLARRGAEAVSMSRGGEKIQTI